MNSVSRILGETRVRFEGRLRGKVQSEESLASLVMDMLVDPNTLDFTDPRVPNQIKAQSESGIHKLLARLYKETVSHKQKPGAFSPAQLRGFAREARDISDTQIRMANAVSWLISDKQPHQKVEEFSALYVTQYNFLLERARELARSMDPGGYLIYSLERGQDVDWL